MIKRGFVEISEGQVHYRTEGQGTPLLLLHQTPMSSDEFSAIIPILAAGHYRVIAMDTPGYGDSYKPAAQFQVADYARRVIDFLDAIGVKEAHLAGHHTGATIAGELAAAYPRRFGKLVLSGCPCFKQPEEGHRWLNEPRYRPLELKADGSHLMTIWGKAMERYPATSLELADDYVIDYLKAGARREDGHTAVFVYDAYPRLPLIKSPTLVMCGDEDSLYPYLETVAGLVPGSTLKIIKGGKAHVTRLMPEVWAQNVLEFLAGR